MLLLLYHYRCPAMSDEIQSIIPESNQNEQNVPQMEVPQNENPEKKLMSRRDFGRFIGFDF